jgi:large subunit ribosomal protein L30
MDKSIKITLVKSTIATKPNHKRIIQALGLRKLNGSVIQKDKAATRGMINKVSHLVKVEEV